MVVLAGAGATAHAQGRDNHGVERVRFRNIGDATIPQGSRVQWYVEKGQGGEFFLPSDLPVGKELTEADLLKLGVPAKTDCMSKLAA